MLDEFPFQEIRSLLLDYLKDHPNGQFGQVVKGVVNLAKSKGLYSEPNSDVHTSGGSSYGLHIRDIRRVPEAVREQSWGLVGQGILMPGLNVDNPNWPFYKVTEYGQQILAQEGPRPYDPEGFLREFAEVNPNADPIVIDYLEEAVHTFNTGCCKAAAVMLGCASEQLVLLLHEKFENAIADPAERQRFSNSYGRPITSKYRSLRNGLDAMVSAKKLKDFRDAVQTFLGTGFELIRRVRNNAGHPNLPADIRRDAVYINLAFFPEYAREVGRLIDHFGPNPAEPDV